MSEPRRTPPGRSVPPNVPRLGVLRSDTIVAVATAPGRGAVALIRVSGAAAEQICRRVIAPWPDQPRIATRVRLHEMDDPSAPLDDGLVTLFRAPRSYTGETVVEIGTHGGGFVPAAVCAALVAAGARPAEPGEFTQRAVLNGKLDLLRAEAIDDLITAKSRASHRAAMQHVAGALSERFGALREGMLELEALLAYDIDFPEEDGGRLPRTRIRAACEALVAELERLLATVPAAQLGRDGATIVLAGPPNAGKSSLLNALIGETRVIVSETPGTTRDAVEVLLEHDPWPLRLVDTAGLRESVDPLERLGIEMSERYLASAHAVIACADSAAALERACAEIAARTAAPVIGVLTKCELLSETERSATATALRVSAVRGEGLDTLLQAVTRAVADRLGALDPDTPMITRARHRAALTEARDELMAFSTAWEMDALPAPVAAVHVRTAARTLDVLIGAVDIEEVFTRVFSRFCIGK